MLVDRLIKIIALKGLLTESFWFLGYPRFTLHKNFGLAFDLPLARGIIIVLSLVFIMFLVFLLLRDLKKDKTCFSGLVFMIAGALANLIDRVQYGFVVDMIEVFPGSIWNIADVMILLGIALIILQKPARVTAN